MTGQLTGSMLSIRPALNLLYSIGNLPDGAAFDASTGTLTWTPAKSQMSRTPNDTYRIDLTASNGLFDVTKSLYIYVAYQNKSPFFLPIVDFKQIQYTVSASSASGTIASQGNLDNATGTITLNMDLSGRFAGA